MKYRLIEEKQLPDLQGVGYVYEHNMTKARVCFIKTDDDNKTFSIAFRTPPADDSGIAHILEHSVLCGSRKYPIKDPFIELAKGSLNTFLNAMTYSDKTMYPVASVNDQDFHNLVDVYMDAVFYPDIYKNSMTFRQEGWHYDLENIEDKVIYKGVVYNEMKGVFSSPEQILFRKIQQTLFEDHPYSFESGGDPMFIPKLSEEQFLDFHKSYYHPSNSFIFFYGDLDMEKEMEWLDREYLSDFEYLEIDSKIPLVKRYKEPRHIEVAYPVAKGEENGNKSYLSYCLVLNESKEVLDGIGFDILEYLLIDAPGAPLKEALIKEGIGDDVFSSFDGSIREGTFSIIAKNCNKDMEARFIEIIEEQLALVARNGFETKKVKAAINKFEFKAKEADFGQYPKGVIYAIKSLETWLHDESPFINFAYDEIFEKAKVATENGLLQRLVQEYFIDNNHKVHLTLVPDESFNDKKQEVIKSELEAYEATLNEVQREEIVANTKKLVIYQETPETKENLEKLPQLTLADIPRDKKEFKFNNEMIKDTKLLLHEANATNIAYVKCSFDISYIPEEQLDILSLLSRMLLKMSTTSHTYGELSDEINGRTGGINATISVYDHKKSSKYYAPKLELSGKCFIPKLKDLFSLIKEITMETDFSDVERIRELINENKSRIQMSLITAGHSTALLRAESYFSKSASYKEKLKGLEFYNQLELWQKKSDEDLKDLGSLIKRMLGEIVSSDRLTIGVSASHEYMEQVREEAKEFVFSIPYAHSIKVPVGVTLVEARNEGFQTTSDVQYVAMAADFRKQGFEYVGSLKVLNTILNLDYLWNNVRIKGGAYGAFAGLSRNGLMYFASYRDPNLAETVTTFKNMWDYIGQIDIDQRELTKYIIGTMSPLDQPMTPSLENDKMMSLYYSEVTHEDIVKNRLEILDTTVDSLKSHQELYQKIFSEDYLCVVGNDKKIEANKELFNSIKELK